MTSLFGRAPGRLLHPERSLSAACSVVAVFSVGLYMRRGSIGVQYVALGLTREPCRSRALPIS
jgi:hypothetical protein